MDIASQTNQWNAAGVGQIPTDQVPNPVTQNPPAVAQPAPTTTKARGIESKAANPGLPKKKRVRVKKPVKCPICKEEFAGDLNRHIRTHNPPTIACKYASFGCQKMFKQKSNSATHAKTCPHMRPMTIPTFDWSAK